MRILHIICTDGVSGAEKYLNFLLPGMSRYGHECHLLIIHPSKSLNLLLSFAKDLNNAGVKTTLITNNSLFSIPLLKKIKRYLQEHQLNIIHSHLLRSDILSFFVKTLFSIVSHLWRGPL